MIQLSYLVHEFYEIFHLLRRLRVHRVWTVVARHTNAAIRNMHKASRVSTPPHEVTLLEITKFLFASSFLFFSSNVIGIHIRVSEQDASMLVQVPRGPHACSMIA